MLSWCKLKWCHMHASCRWSQGQWIVLWNSQNGQSLLWNQWAVNHQDACTKHDSLIPEAASNKRGFLSFLSKTRNTSPWFHIFFFFFFFFVGMHGFFFCLFHLCLCVFLLSHLYSLCDREHILIWYLQNVIPLTVCVYGTGCGSRWDTLHLVRGESCGRHCLTWLSPI